MKIVKLAVVLLLVQCFCGFSEEEESNPPQKSTIEVFFSPKGGCTKAIIEKINKAKESIFVQAYSFTSQSIAQALRNASKDNIKVQVILDKSNKDAKYSVADYLSSNMTTLIDARHQIAHDKIMIIDSKIIITGSFNFTKSAEEGNAENLLIINSPELAKKYIENWNKHAEHSEPFVKKEEPQ